MLVECVKMWENVSEAGVFACHYVCAHAFALVLIRQAFGICQPARGFEGYSVHCVRVCLCTHTDMSGGALKACLALIPQRQGTYSEMKQDLDQHVQFLAELAP